MKLILTLVFSITLLTQLAVASPTASSCKALLSNKSITSRFEELIDSFNSSNMAKASLTNTKKEEDELRELNNKLVIEADKILRSRNVSTFLFLSIDGYNGLFINHLSTSELGRLAVRSEQLNVDDMYFIPLHTILSGAKGAYIQRPNDDGSKSTAIALPFEAIVDEELSFIARLIIEHEFGHANFYKLRSSRQRSIFYPFASSVNDKPFPIQIGKYYFKPKAYDKTISFEEVPLYFNDSIKVLKKLIKDLEDNDLTAANLTLEFLINRLEGSFDVMNRVDDVISLFIPNLENASTAIDEKSIDGHPGVVATILFNGNSFELAMPLHPSQFRGDNTLDFIEEQLSEVAENAQFKKNALAELAGLLSEMTLDGITLSNSHVLLYELKNAILPLFFEYDDLPETAE